MQFARACLLDPKDLFSELETSEAGLTSSQANERKQKFGANTLSAHQASWIDTLLNQLRSPFVYLLVAASVVSLILGEKVDALIIISFVAINTLLGFWQEYRAAISLSKLRKLITKTSSVFRDGKTALINDEDIVTGDVLALKAGDRIPAEVRFISGRNISVDESILTGESAPVTKFVQTLSEEPKTVIAASNVGFSGTLLTAGECTAVVISTGNETQLGFISKLTVETDAQSGFSKEMAEISRAVIYLMLATIGVVILLHIFVKGPAANLAELSVFAIALAVGVVPEALPLVITLSLSSGAMRLAQKKVVPKRLSSIEDLGSVDVLCTDKTGTITGNVLTLSDMFSQDQDRLIKYALLGVSVPENMEEPTNPFDKAIWTKALQTDRNSNKLALRIAEIPFDPFRKRDCAVVEIGGKKVSVVRGAYEEILPLCINDSKDGTGIKDFIEKRGSEGKRVIAIAHKDIDSYDLNKVSEIETNLNFDGLMAFYDPLKDTSIEAIAEAEKLGIQIKILTGDSMGVARSVGETIGLVSDESGVMTGKDYDDLSEDEKEKVVSIVNVFARVTPQQKFDIVRVLRKRHMVGFLGEGFNDAPALKEAHVGLVVDNASDVAKDAADIILLSKDLKTIIDGIKEGRTTFTNTVKYIRTTLTSNFGNFFALAFSSLFVPFLPMLPIQILLVNFLSDLPMVSVSTDTVDQGNLRKPKIYSIKSIMTLSLILGLVSTVFDFSTFFYFVRFGETTLQTLWFMESVLTELVLLFSIRTSKFFLKSYAPSKLISLLSVVIFALTVGIPYTKIGRTLFSFNTPRVEYLLVLLVILVSYFTLTEVVKLIYYRFQKADIKF